MDLHRGREQPDERARTLRVVDDVGDVVWRVTPAAPVSARR